MIRSVADFSVFNQAVFVRADFNVPMDEQGRILDDTRIVESIGTLKHLLEQGARVVVGSHLGRPKGFPSEALSLLPVGLRLAELLYPLVPEIRFSEDPTLEGNKKLFKELNAGELLLLENLRFDKREEANDESFAKELAQDIDLYVNEAFSCSHRAHASTVGMVKYVPQKAAGFLFLREVGMLRRLLGVVDRPYIAILGGKKIDDKMAVIDRLLGKIQTLLIGGAMSHPFLQATGALLGTSIVDERQVNMAKGILDRAQKSNVEIVLPIDAVVSRGLTDSSAKIVSLDSVPKDMGVFDIGPKTVDKFERCLLSARTVFWNGPMGAYEHPPFHHGTVSIAKALAHCQGFTVVGGGDSVAALQAASLTSKISHISTGGGASLEFIEGKTLPGILALAQTPARNRGFVE